MKILGIETSCDETACAVLEGRKIISSVVATQYDVHARYGGVVPELASRRHMENIVPVVRAALEGAHTGLADIGAVAVTCAPGLVGSLLVGLSAAKGIAYTNGLKLIGVNHLEGHLNAAELEFGPIPVPYVGLVVSGGHTSLYFVRGFGDYRLLGNTRDDAAGEAFDKVAKLLGLGFPGGPAIEEAARDGDPKAFRFSRPKFDSDNGFDFSFSGIKTAVMLLHRKESAGEKVGRKFIVDAAASFQNAVTEMLVEQLLTAARVNGAKAVVLAGGVAANRGLRERLKTGAETARLPCYIPSLSLCTDNAAMIAYVGQMRLARGESSAFNLNAEASQEIGV